MSPKWMNNPCASSFVSNLVKRKRRKRTRRLKLRLGNEWLSSGWGWWSAVNWRPSITQVNDNVAATIRENVRDDRRRLIVDALTNETAISIGRCRGILTDNLRMRRVAAKFVPRLLTSEQKENRHNAPAHSALPVREFSTDNEIPAPSLYIHLI